MYSILLIVLTQTWSNVQLVLVVSDEGLLYS